MNESSKLALLGSNARPTLISYDGLQSRCAMRLGCHGIERGQPETRHSL